MQICIAVFYYFTIFSTIFTQKQEYNTLSQLITHFVKTLELSKETQSVFSSSIKLQNRFKGY